MTANPEHAPELWSALWRAAYDLGALRQSGRGQTRTVEVLVDEVWVAGTAQCPWDVLLTRDDRRFLQIVDQAIATSGPYKHSFDYLRRLRDLAKKPTEMRLRNFIRDAAAADRNDMNVADSGFSYAGRRTGIFPDELPSDWVERVAREPEQIAQLAQGFLNLIELRSETRGRTEDIDVADARDEPKIPIGEEVHDAAAPGQEQRRRDEQGLPARAMVRREDERVIGGAHMLQAVHGDDLPAGDQSQPAQQQTVSQI